MKIAYGKITKSEVLKYIDEHKKLNPTSVIYVPTLLSDASGIYSSTEKDPYKDISYVISAKILSVITGSDVKITDLDEDKVIKSIKTIESHTRDDYFKALAKNVPEGLDKLRDQFIEYTKMRKRNGEKENE